MKKCTKVFSILLAGSVFRSFSLPLLASFFFAACSPLAPNAVKTAYLSGYSKNSSVSLENSSDSNEVDNAVPTFIVSEQEFNSTDFGSSEILTFEKEDIENLSRQGEIDLPMYFKILWFWETNDPKETFQNGRNYKVFMISHLEDKSFLEKMRKNIISKKTNVGTIHIELKDPQDPDAKYFTDFLESIRVQVVESSGK